MNRARDLPPHLARRDLRPSNLRPLPPRRVDWRAQALTRQTSRKARRLVLGEPSPHLFVSVGEEMIESLDSNEAEAWIFHIGHRVERDGQGSCK